MEYFIRYIIIIFILSALAISCKTENTNVKNNESTSIKTDTVVKLVQDSVAKKYAKPIEKQPVKRPDYIPPENGGVNEKWSNNRHRTLSKDSNCYFGKGIQKRYRYRGGRQDLE